MQAYSSRIENGTTYHPLAPFSSYRTYTNTHINNFIIKLHRDIHQQSAGSGPVRLKLAERQHNYRLAWTIITSSIWSNNFHFVTLSPEWCICVGKSIICIAGWSTRLGKYVAAEMRHLHPDSTPHLINDASRAGRWPSTSSMCSGEY